MTQPVTPHHPLVVTRFEGGDALSDFRARQLLPRLQAVDERIDGVSARFVHLVATDTAPDAAQQAQLQNC